MKKILKDMNWGLVLVIGVAAVTRLTNLNWGLPYDFHPDEFNMAVAITRLNWQESLNPRFFAYGQFPLYLAYFSAVAQNFLSGFKSSTIGLSSAVLWLRIYSGVAGVGTVFLVYFLSKKLFSNKNIAFLTALLAVFTPGLIQTSHFGTTESLLSFFYLTIVYLSILIIEKQSFKYFFLLALVLGFSLGTKITALVFFSAVIFSFYFCRQKKYFLILLFIPLIILLSSPHLWISLGETKNTLLYETSVATGKSAVFYTRQFIHTKPVLFQFKNIFPYVLGWPIYILGSVGIFLATVFLFRNKDKGSLRKNTLLFLISFWLYFFSQAFLFTKWTRFMAPIFAFFPVFAGFSFLLIKKLKGIILIFCIIPGVLFAFIYFSPDIRFTATDWISQNLPREAKILSESGNVVDLGFGQDWPNFTSFDYYSLDENKNDFSKLLTELEKNEYLFVPSRRVFANHLRLPELFPKTAKYYRLLFGGKLGFKEIKKIEPFYSKIFEDEKAEETFSVFDHPTIRIFKKTVNLTKADYEKLFEE